MNSFIEVLNRWGGDFLNFAWPMCWQSSLLIVVLLAVDRMFRQKLRASIRYAFWLVVLVKLCVPPTLALPTSPAWWLHRVPAVAVAPPVLHYTVTYDSDPLPALSPLSQPVLKTSKPALNCAAWLLVASAGLSAILLCWLLVRWWQVARAVGRAEESEQLTILAGEVQRSAGLRFKVQVKVTASTMSPAVCGLFRPAILMPRALTEQFSHEQLRAVLLHELIHLRRRDVWVNFLQSLLQIGYWWHPLVWVANARIRRVREEAVDDAVMLALRDDAEAYAPTLLEVAKLALNRPLASLGLVGILESRRALRQRIERLVDFRAPRRAGLTVMSALGVMAFTVVAVPMGQGPVTADGATPVAPKIPVAAGTETNNESILVVARFFQSPSGDLDHVVLGLKPDGERHSGDPCWQVAPEEFAPFIQRIREAGFKPTLKPQILTKSGKPAEMFIGNETNNVTLTCTPRRSEGLISLLMRVETVGTYDGVSKTNLLDFNTALKPEAGIMAYFGKSEDGTTSNTIVLIQAMVITNTTAWLAEGRTAATMAKRQAEQTPKGIRAGPGREEIIAQLRRIRFTGTDNDNDLTLKQVLDNFNELVRFYEKVHPGGNFTFVTSASAVPVPRIDPATGQPVRLPDAGAVIIHLSPVLKDESLLAMLDDVVKNASQPIHYFISGDKVVFSIKSPEDTTMLYTRAYNLDPNTFISNLALDPNFRKTTNIPTEISAAARKYFNKLGADFGVESNSPAGKTLFFNNQTGTLFVKATLADFDIIQKAIVTTPAPQIHVKARFLEVPANVFKKMVVFDGDSSGKTNGVVTSKRMAEILKWLAKQTGVETLAEPEMVTTTGRHAQMRATQIVNVVTNMAHLASGTNIFQTTVVETGPLLDEISYALSDGYTIYVYATAEVVDFLGYETPSSNSGPIDNDGRQIPTVKPLFKISEVAAGMNLYDNQTMVFLGVPSHLSMGKELTTKTGTDKKLVVLITATLIDAAGNRIHSDDDLPFDKNTVPPQTGD